MMTESAMSLRPASGAEEFEHRMPSLGPSSAPPGDALAELARLVGQQDPFRDLPAAPSETPAPLAAEADYAAFDTQFGRPLDREDYRAPAKNPALVRSPVDDAGWERAALRYPAISVRDQHDREPSPDAWAQGAVDRVDDVEPAPGATADQARAEAGGSKRTLIVLAAVVALTGGGLAASFLAKPSGAAASASTVAAAAPTIMAAAGPTKVQPEAPVSGTDAPSQPSTLLDKNNNDGTTAARVVNTIEQPVDLNQAIKPAASAEAVPAAPPSAFPEPRRVKTVLVRPDGSIIANAAPAAEAEAVAAPSDDQASLAFDPKTSLPIAAAPPVAASVPTAPSVAADTAAGAPNKPATPAAKSTTRAAPKAAASTTQDASAAAQARTTVATPKTKPVVHAPARPVALATAAPDATAPGATTPDAAAPDAATPTAGAGGAYAIQLGAAPSEAEGQDAAKRLAQKYALGASMPSVIKAQAGGKTVYRIRVGHLSQGEAKALCAKVQTGGGGCFVAHN